MPAPDPFAPFVEPLERLGLPYCITGSVAASIYGEPRLTADIDIVPDIYLAARDTLHAWALEHRRRTVAAMRGLRFDMEPFADSRVVESLSYEVQYLS